MQWTRNDNWHPIIYLHFNSLPDCSGNGADFDSPIGPEIGHVSIYQGSNNSVYQNITLGWANVQPIPYNTDNPCISVPPSLCGQRGVYVFDVELPIVNESYHVSYQRCCRNNTINNIINPSESGVTFTVEITAVAQSLCNSSPVFENLPEEIICVNENISIDVSAVDEDGDELVYSFCSPLLGGSLLDAAPDPDDPPPYEGVEFNIPDYTATAPLGGTPVVSINSFSGLISGVVNVQGQFVVGICVEEYRNGQLLSSIQRDYQFNITICESLIDAQLANPSSISDGIYIYNSCTSSILAINNESSVQNIEEYEMAF